MIGEIKLHSKSSGMVVATKSLALCIPHAMTAISVVRLFAAIKLHLPTAWLHSTSLALIKRCGIGCVSPDHGSRPRYQHLQKDVSLPRDMHEHMLTCPLSATSLLDGFSAPEPGDTGKTDSLGTCPWQPPGWLTLLRCICGIPYGPMVCSASRSRIPSLIPGFHSAKGFRLQYYIFPTAACTHWPRAVSTLQRSQEPAFCQWYYESLRQFSGGTSRGFLLQRGCFLSDPAGRHQQGKLLSRVDHINNSPFSDSTGHMASW